MKDTQKTYLKKHKLKRHFSPKGPPFSKNNESLFIVEPQIEKSEDSFISIKMDLLTNKLKHKNKQSTIDFSRLTNLKQTKSPELAKNSKNYNESITTDLRQQKEQLFSKNEQQIEYLQQKSVELVQKNRYFNEIFKSKKADINCNLDTLIKLLHDIDDRSMIFNTNKKQFSIYSDLLNPSQQLKQTPLRSRKSNSRKVTISSIFKQPSLLLSFKKNIDEDDAYVTLKYSQQSNHRQKTPPNQTLPQGWESFHKDNRQKTKKNLLYKSVNKEAEMHQQIQEKYFQNIKNSILQSLNEEKKYLANSFQDSVNIVQKFEDVLQKIVEEVACEKVERQDQWKELECLRKEGLFQISSLVSKLKMDFMAEQFMFQQKVKEIETIFYQRLVQQKGQRKSQQKLMTKMMLEVVQFYQ